MPVAASSLKREPVTKATVGNPHRQGRVTRPNRRFRGSRKLPGGEGCKLMCAPDFLPLTCLPAPGEPVVAWTLGEHDGTESLILTPQSNRLIDDRLLSQAVGASCYPFVMEMP